MTYLLMLAVSAIEVMIIYKIRYAYSRLPIFAIMVSIITITALYSISILSVNKYLRAYTFNFATVDLVLLVIMLVYMYQMKRDLRDLPVAKQPDFLVILGNKCMGSRVPPILSERLEKTIQLYNNFERKPQIIVSGSKSSESSYETEAEMMRKYLIDHNIPESAIIKEDESINTVQNLEYSAIEIHQTWQKKTRPRVIIVTSDYHIPRTKWHAKRLGLEVQFAAACTVRMLKWPAMFREFTAIVWYHRYSLLTLLGMDLVFSLSMCM
ncbi:YdcF family protein [Companilactobacillus paralimentarius]|uniref:YdcF family protein n=1 Tax=Companilactobacillus paralimentarius TaxID=83526 RepID=UPI002853166B|nr:YdcF family protein [Companilactobacillus paralimentarius]MDR4932369.1 YdcF family protein [Companilactobacillus paralimentarius]